MRDRVLKRGQLAKAEVGQTGLLARESRASVQQPPILTTKAKQRSYSKGVTPVQCVRTGR